MEMLDDKKYTARYSYHNDDKKYEKKNSWIFKLETK